MQNDCDLESILNTALAQQDAGRFDLAETGYRTVLRHNPHDLDALNLLAVVLQERGEVDESLALLTQALAIDPDFPEALANLARVHRLMGAHALAADAARRAVALDLDLAAAHLQLGRALFDLGDHAGAAEALRQATVLAPHSVEGLVPLGMALIRMHDPRAADVPLTAALALVPDGVGTTLNLAPALAELARAYREGGDGDAAVAAGRRAVALDPALPEPHRQLGRALLMQQDHAGAVEALQRATEIARDSAEAWVGLATALTRGKEHGPAVEAWEAALALRPDTPGLLVEYAASLSELGRFEESLVALRLADSRTPGYPAAQIGLCVMLTRIGDVAGAAELSRRALATTPDWAKMWLILADCEAMQGNFVAATEAYRRAATLDPGSADALHGLAVIHERLGDDEVGDAAATVVNDPSRPARDRIAAGFALGRVRDRDGDHDQAFEAYAAANRLLRTERAARAAAFDREAYRRLVDQQIALIDPRTFVETADWGDPSELPVFIVGMPRSGTTLVEQIASSHPLVFGAGELREIENILTALDGERTACSPAAWDRAAARREAVSHVQRLGSLGGRAIRVIDKNVDAVICLGQIAVLFPRARIVVCRRDPRDITLSCYFQYFRDDRMMWTDDLADCGFRARETDRLVAHWRKVLPVPILELQYETLVANLEQESRRLIDFLGLNWDPACLTFHETQRAVMTASQWQVRQPLYASSVGRWRHYQHHLGPLLRELEGPAPPR